MPWTIRRLKTRGSLSPYQQPLLTARSNEELGDDVATKLQLHGIFTALKRGKIPTNDQIDIALNSLMKNISESEHRSQMSPEGEQALKSLLQTIEAAKILILVKNQGDLIQKLLWNTAHAAHSKELKPLTLPIGKNTAKLDAKEVVDGLKTLAMLLLTNGQFRKLLRDSTVLIREIASDAAQHAATSIRPSEEEVVEADRPIEDNTWHEPPEKLKFSLRRSMKSGSLRRNLRTSRSNSRVKDGSKESAVAADLARSRSVVERTKAFLAQKIPEERREQKIWRLKRMIVEIQGHSDYQRAVETLIGLAEEYAHHLHDVVSQSGEAAEEIKNDSQLRASGRILKTLLESFANNTSLDEILQSAKEFYDLASNDDELKGWLKGVNFLVRECLLNHGHVLEESTTDKWNKLYDQANYLFGARYRLQMEKTVENVQAFLNQFEKDTFNNTLMDSIKRLLRDINRDDKDGFSLKRPVMRDLKKVVLPTLARNIKTVPIPRIEIVGHLFEMVLDDIVIQSSDFFPNKIELELENRLLWSRRGQGKRDSEFQFAAGGMQAVCKDAQWCFKYKRGGGLFAGTMSVALAGDGLHIKVDGNLGHRGQGHIFKVKKVDVDASNLVVAIQSEEHKALVAFVKHIAIMTIRSAVEKFLEKKIKRLLEKTDEFAYNVHREAQDAKKEARQKNEKKSHLYRFYFDAFRRNLAEFKADRKQRCRRRRVRARFVFTSRDSILQHVKRPGALLNQADMFQGHIESHGEWKSLVFAIGSASPTMHLPYRAPIRHRPGYRRFKLSPPNVDRAGVEQITGAVGPAEPVPLAEAMDMELGNLDLRLNDQS
ncbi:hypothetical protein KEM54_004540 [Ascosphaera aggregata]|nr:hypothetical protein KEM54_004540 [Ascosphaera aggregata]